MDEISRALPELLWLKKLEMKGNTVKLSGQAFNTNAVASFVDNLDRVPEFKEPYLRETKRNGQVYDFSIEFEFHVVPDNAARAAGTQEAASASAPSGG